MRALIAAALPLFAQPVLAEVPQVVADMPVTASLVQMVMGDLGQPTVLLPGGGDVHHYQLRPSQAAALQDAPLLVWVGPALTPWLDRFATDDPARTLTLLDVPGTQRRGFGAAGAPDHGGEHGDGHVDGHGDGHDDGHDGDHDKDSGAADVEQHAHDADGLDPHAWLDPANGRAWVAAIAEALAARDPDNAATYRENAAAATAMIDSADADAADMLADLRADRTSRDVVVFHDAYGYFTDHYGLRPALPVAWGDAAAPSAQHLDALRDIIAQGDIACALPEANHDPKLLLRLAEDTGIRVGGALDPSGSGLEPGATLYPELLRNMALTIAECMEK